MLNQRINAGIGEDVSKLDSFADYEIAEGELDLVSGGCGGGRRPHGRGNAGGRGDGNVGMANSGSVGGNVIAISGDVIVNGNGTITIVGGDLATA